MDTFADRIRAAMTARDLTPADLIRKGVLSKAGIYFLLDGTTSPDKVRESTIAKLVKALSVDRDWLMTGRGQMNPSASRTSPDAPPKAGRVSQPAIPDPDILHEALTLLVYDETVAGAYAPRAQAARLAELYGRVAADHGRLSSAHNREFEDEVQERRGSHDTSSQQKARKRDGKR